MRRPGHSAVTTVLLTALVVSGCALGRADPPDGTEVSWRQVQRSGWGSAAYAVALASPLDASSPTGFLALVDTDGHTRFLRTGPGDNVGVASDGRTLCASTATTSYRLTSSSAHRVVRTQAGQSTDLTTVLPSGGCGVVVDAGDRSDIYVYDTDRTSHVSLPVSPLVVGSDDSAFWVSAGQDLSDRWTLSRVDLRTSAVTRAATWRADPPDHRAPGVVDPHVSAVGGRIFSLDRRLYLLEEVVYLESGKDTAVEIEPGMTSQLAWSTPPLVGTSRAS